MITDFRRWGLSTFSGQTTQRNANYWLELWQELRFDKLADQNSVEAVTAHFLFDPGDLGRLSGGG